MSAQDLSSKLPDDMAQSREFAGLFFSVAEGLPTSFLLDGERVEGIPAQWNPIRTRRTIDSALVETVYVGQDPRTGLKVRFELTQYRDYPVTECVAWLTNEGSATTPVISDLLVFDGLIPGSNLTLNHYNGDFDSPEGYEPHLSPIQAGEALSLAPTGGKPSRGVFPYFRLIGEGCGHTIAVGWPGQWKTTVVGVESGAMLQVGQEEVSLKLLPRESIRTPRLTIMSWTGEVSRSVNLWRRWYLAHILPRPNGLPLQTMLTCCGTDEGEEFTAATEENQLRYIDKFRDKGIDFDLWWIDAGWYPCHNKDHERRWWRVGTWEPDAERFPSGLRSISERATDGDADLLLWFEPERVQPGTKLDLEHPDWLLTREGGEDKLLNWGIPECRKWLTNHISNIIQDNAIKVYRQDHNFSPLEYWRQNDNLERRGMNENQYVQGYLQYWDDLVERNPGLWIDSCAGGGARNDLETMRRSVPLHYSDHGYGDHAVKLAFHRTLFEWIPYFKEFTLSWDIDGNSRFDSRVDSFSFYCAMAPMLFATLDIRRNDYDFSLARQMISVWRRVSEMILHGDYYPHTPHHRSPAEWVALQFDCPDRGCGFIQAIRLQECPEESFSMYPKAIDSNAGYTFENLETGEVRHVDGCVLLSEGFTFELPVRSGAIWVYRRNK